MRQTKFLLSLLAAAALAACSEQNAGNQTLKTKFTSQVTFGDSLADVGSYAVPSIVQAGGGKFTINGASASNPELSGKVWTEFTAAQFGLPADCAYQTGLNGQGQYSAPVTTHAGCYNYAQGGARVSNPIGRGNILTGDPLGALTVPVTKQMDNHLARVGGKFTGTEVVMVMAGGNDLLMLLAQLTAAATASGTAAGNTAFATSLAGQLAAKTPNPQTSAAAIGAAIQTASAAGKSQTEIVMAAIGAAVTAGADASLATQAVYGPLVAKAQSDATAAGAAAGAAHLTTNGPAAVQQMTAAGTELANLVKTKILANGANYVVVNNLPDVAITPTAKSRSETVQGLIKQMGIAFNTALKAGLTGEAKVLYVDLFTLSDDQIVNPGPYGLTNTTTPACGPNALNGSAVICNTTNVISGDVSHYLFADGVHPTPFEHSLIARYVAEQMVVKGWL